MVETRSNVTGAYKGLIYCSSLDEVNNILSEIQPILQKFLNYKFNRQYDYVVASGAFNLKVKNQTQYIQSCIEKLFSVAKKGVAFNLLSERTLTKNQDKLFWYYSPSEILNLAFVYTPYVGLNHHYLPNDFTVFMFKSEKYS